MKLKLLVFTYATWVYAAATPRATAAAADTIEEDCRAMRCQKQLSILLMQITWLCSNSRLIGTYHAGGLAVAPTSWAAP